MANKIVLFTPEELKNHSFSDGAVAAYAWALANAGTVDEAAVKEFIATRNSMAEGFRDLWEVKSFCEKLAETIKTVVKHAMNEGEEKDLPRCASWNAQTFQSKFSDPVGAAKILAEKYGKDIAAFTCGLSPSQAMKIAGINEDTLKEDVGENFVKTPKERTLVIK